MQFELYTHRSGFGKRILKWSPEIYFLIVLTWWFTSTYFGQKQNDNTVFINYPALILVVTLLVQFFIKNKHLGVTVAAVLVLGTFFLILSMFSFVLYDWDFNQHSAKFLIYSGIFIGLNLFMAFRMFRRYSKMYDFDDTGDVPLGI
jgi:hypothetical protein